MVLSKDGILFDISVQQRTQEGAYAPLAAPNSEDPDGSKEEEKQQQPKTLQKETKNHYDVWLKGHDNYSFSKLRNAIREYSKKHNFHITSIIPASSSPSTSFYPSSRVVMISYEDVPEIITPLSMEAIIEKTIESSRLLPFPSTIKRNILRIRRS